MLALALLAEKQPRLPAQGAPRASGESNMVVRMHLDQAQGFRRGTKLQDRRTTLVNRLFREGLQRPSSASLWAAQHTSSKDNATLSVLVMNADAARTAAHAAVEVGSVTVGDYTVPVTWDQRPAPPPECTIVILHQIPVEYVRQGCGAVLLAAAGQEGEVVAEFLGGCSRTGDAALSCPAADRVVVWVRPPPWDPLLTSLPASFQVGRAQWATIEVAGRQSQAPDTWQMCTQAHLRAYQAVQETINRQLAQQQQAQQDQPCQQQPPQGPQQLADQLPREWTYESCQPGGHGSVPATTAPRQQQQQQQDQQGERLPQHRLQRPQQQVQQQRGAQQQQRWVPGDSGLGDWLLQRGLQRPEQQQGPVSDDDVAMPDAEPAPQPYLVERQQQLQQQQPQQQQHQQHHQQQHQQEQEQQQQLQQHLHQQQQQQEEHEQFVQSSVDDMLETARTLADDEGDEDQRKLSADDRRRLQHTFQQHFHKLLLEQEFVPLGQLRAWIRRQLGIKQRAYGDSSSDDEDPRPGPTTRGRSRQRKSQGQQQRQQQQQQQGRGQPPLQQAQHQGDQQQASPRRSSRVNRGQMSNQFAVLFGRGKAPDTSELGGVGASSQACAPGTQPAAAPQPRATRRGRSQV